jgi:RNA polymerase sigma-70 factor (ECF subfamily)
MSTPDGSRTRSSAPADSPRTALTHEEFETMTVALAQPLMAAALRLTRRRADAEDLVQDTLYRAFRSLSSFERGTHFKAWLFRILKNAYINRGKREAAAPAATDPADLDITGNEASVPDLVDLRELAAMSDHHFDERVKAAVDGLPDAYRVPLVLFSLGDLSYLQIAETLQIPIGTVMSRLHRARMLLKAELAEYARSQRFPVEGR